MPIVRSALLRRELIRQRTEHGLTREQVADDLEWSLSKIIHIERGTTQFSEEELDRLLDEYEIISTSQRLYLHSLHRDESEALSARATSATRLAGTIHTLISALIVATFMSHRHPHEPADDNSSHMARYRPLAGIAAAR